MKAWNVWYSVLRESKDIRDIEEIEMTVQGRDVEDAVKNAKDRICMEYAGTDVKKTVIWSVGMIAGVDPEDVFED